MYLLASARSTDTAGTPGNGQSLQAAHLPLMTGSWEQPLLLLQNPQGHGTDLWAGGGDSTSQDAQMGHTSLLMGALGH